MKGVELLSWKVRRISLSTKLFSTKRQALRAAGVGMATAVLYATTGCQLCCPPYLDDYATVGGKWSRSHPSEGVVGSAFSDPGVVQAGGEMVISQEDFSEANQTEHFVPEPLDAWPSDAESVLQGEGDMGIIILE